MILMIITVLPEFGSGKSRHFSEIWSSLAPKEIEQWRKLETNCRLYSLSDVMNEARQDWSI